MAVRVGGEEVPIGADKDVHVFRERRPRPCAVGGDAKADVVASICRPVV